MKNNIRAIQLDIDTIGGEMEGKYQYDYDDLVSYIEEKIGDMKNKKDDPHIAYPNTIYLQCGPEFFSEGEKNKRVNSLFFDAGPDVKAKIISTDFLINAIKLIKEKAPECTLMLWAPTLSCGWLTNDDENIVVKSIKAVKEEKEGKKEEEREYQWYKRASPFSQSTFDRLDAFFHALGQISKDVDGILFQDDLYLNEYEDVSGPGKAILKANFGIDDDNALYGFMDDENNSDNQTWKQLKVQALNNVTETCTAAFKRGYKEAFPKAFKARQDDSDRQLMFARDLYHGTAYSAPDEYNGQQLTDALKRYDQVVMMAYYYEEKEYVASSHPDDSCAWIKTITEKSLACARSVGNDYIHRLVFKPQSVIWKEQDIPLPADELKRQAMLILSLGGEHIAFYPAFNPESSFNLNTLK